MESIDEKGNFNVEKFKELIGAQNGNVVEDGENLKVEIEGYEIEVDSKTGEVKAQEGEKKPEIEPPEEWITTSENDPEWYSYGGQEVNKPKLTKDMTPIKYTGEIGTENTNKWANAITADGSMWVWIPRYAYKIESGYQTNEEGEIKIKFLEGTGNKTFDGEAIETEPSKITYEKSSEEVAEADRQVQYLVHPAFTGKPENGGWSEDITGIWVAKFEPTDVSETKDKSKMAIKAGVESLRAIEMNVQFQLAKNSTFGETEKINCHMCRFAN